MYSDVRVSATTCSLDSKKKGVTRRSDGVAAASVGLITILNINPGRSTNASGHLTVCGKVRSCT